MRVKAGGIQTNVPVRRKPRNLDFQALEDQLRSNGWQTTSRGWPKYFCWKKGKASLVVPGAKMNRKQAFLCWWFEKYGIECYSWTKQSGFVRFNAAAWPRPGKKVNSANGIAVIS